MTFQDWGEMEKRVHVCAFGWIMSLKTNDCVFTWCISSERTTRFGQWPKTWMCFVGFNVRSCGTLENKHTPALSAICFLVIRCHWTFRTGPLKTQHVNKRLERAHDLKGSKCLLGQMKNNLRM